MTRDTDKPPVYRCLHHAGYRNCAHEKCHRINRVNRKLWEQSRGQYRNRKRVPDTSKEETNG